MSLGRIDLINCVSASTPGLIPEKMLTDGILMKRPDYYVPTPTWWSALEVPYGFPARMPRIVAYFGTVLRRGESTPATAILATQWVLEVAGVWYASGRTKGYPWHLPTGVLESLVELHLANLAEGADPEAQAYLSELLDHHQSLDWAAAGPYLARRVGGEDDGAARAVGLMTLVN